VSAEAVVAETAAVAAPAESGAPPYSGSRVFALLVLALAITNAATMRAVFGPMQDAAKQALGLDDFHMSLVQGLALAIPAVLALPLGYLIDRTRRVTLMVLMSLLWSAGTVWTGFAHGFMELFLARMFAGFGALCAVPVSISLVADMFSAKTRGRAMLPLTLGIQLGTAIAFAVSGPLLKTLASPSAPHLFDLAPWGGVHLWFGAASFVCTLPLLLMREPGRHELTDKDVKFGPAMRVIWDRRGFLIPLFIGQVSVVMADVAATIWVTPVLIRSYHQQPEQFGPWVGAIILAGGVFGAIIGAFFADFGLKLKYKGGVLLGALILSLFAIPAAAYPIMPSVTWFAIMLAVLLVIGSAVGLVTATVIAVKVPNEARGMCLSAFVVIAAVVGFGAAPTLVTLCSSWMGGEGHIGQALGYSGVAVDVISSLGFLLAMLNLAKRKD
jgi:MFS family permease